MKRSLLCIALAVIVLVACAACGSGKAPQSAAAKSQATTAQPAATKPAATRAPAADETSDEEEVTEPEATVAPEATDQDTLDVRDRAQGLDALKSYRMTWQAEWSGTDNGKTESGTWDWIEEFSSDPKGLHWLWDVKDESDPGKGGKMEWWQVGNTTYLSAKEGECFSLSSDDASRQLDKGGIFNPATLGRVEDAKYVGDETVNGVRTKHYKYDEKAGGVMGLGQVSGEMWIANDGGYLVKETTNWKGGSGLFGLGTSDGEGEGKWTWELTNIDQPITIEPPANCGGAANELPVMPDATEKSSFGDTLSYSTPSKVADVTAFYQKEMPAAGWKADGEPTTTEGMAMLSFAKEGQTAQVIISSGDEGKTSVIISISK